MAIHTCNLTRLICLPLKRIHAKIMVGTESSTYEKNANFFDSKTWFGRLARGGNHETHTTCGFGFAPHLDSDLGTGNSSNRGNGEGPVRRRAARSGSQGDPDRDRHGS